MARILGLMGAYAAGGWLGSLLAIPPGYASAFWLPAGIGLWAVLTWGRRVWPGILLGSFVINVYISAKAIGFHGPLTPFLPLALGIALGATAQAVAGGWLVKRFVGYPTSLLKPRETLQFLALGGPVACVLSPTAGVFLLAWTGTIPAGNVPFAWFNWYVGDTFGVVILLPLLLVFLGEPASTWRRRRGQVGLPILVSLAGVLGTFLLVGHQEDRRVRALFERRAEEINHRLQTTLNDHLTILGLSRAYFDATDQLGPEGFKRFTREVLARNTTLRAIDWAPKVAHEDRAAFEAAAAGEYQIQDRTPQGELQREGIRDTYFPVQFVEPREGNEKVKGYDLASQPDRLEAIERALRTGEPAATRPITLVQGKPHQAGLLIIFPVYRNGAATATTEDRRRALRGLVVGVAQMGDLVEKSLAGADLSLIQFQIQDAEGQGGVLYRHPKEGPDGKLLPPFKAGNTLAVAGTRWDVDYEPTLGFLDANRSPLPWLVEASGLLVTGLLGVFLLGLAVQSELTAQGETQRARAETQARLIAELQRIERELEQSQANITALIESTTGLIWSVDLDFRIVTFNSTLADHLRRTYGTEVQAGATLEMILPEDRVGPWRAYYEQTVAEGHFNEVVTLGDGRTFDLIFHPILQGPEVIGVSVFGLDITSRVKAEAERSALEALLQQAQKMESLGVLAGGIGHDMNNVLGTIIGTASANLEAQPGSKRAFETILRAGERGARIVGSLLNFARQQPVEERELDLNGLLREELGLLENTLQPGLRLDLDLAPDLPTIRGDAAALAQAIMSLCLNAVEAMPEGGTLTVRTRRQAPGWVEVDVADTGHGMTREVLERAMDPFFTTKTDGRATGLGLSTAYSTIRAHQGSLDLQSAPGQGTRARLRFPVCEPAARVPAPSSLGPARTHLKVLIVDDDEPLREALKDVLEVLGHEATDVPCGEEALELLAGGFEPDVVILDLNMPGLGGAGTLPSLRVLRPGLPVVIATGRVDQTALNLVKAFPHVTLLPKPFQMKQLEDHLLMI